MPKRLENRLSLARSLAHPARLWGAEQETHMQDATKVQAIATRLGYPEVAARPIENPAL